MTDITRTRQTVDTVTVTLTLEDIIETLIQHLLNDGNGCPPLDDAEIEIRIGDTYSQLSTTGAQRALRLNQPDDMKLHRGHHLAEQPVTLVGIRQDVPVVTMTIDRRNHS